MANLDFMKEFDYFDGDHFITFNIIEVNHLNNTVTVAISNQGKLGQDTFDLHDSYHPYFEYGIYADKIYLSDFE